MTVIVLLAVALIAAAAIVPAATAIAVEFSGGGSGCVRGFCVKQ